MIRFVYLVNYAEGVSKEDGETWHLNEHVPQVKRLPGIVRYRSWPQVDVGIPYPSPGAPTPHDQFVRRSELCFENLESGVQSVMADPQLWASSKEGVPGFREFECMFLEEQPQYDLLRDAPQEQYKYMSLQLMWPKGRPEVDDTAEIFINSYCILYPSGISIADGEDWYLGHHTREGKQLPGMQHYRTWRTIRVPESTDAPLRPNKWYRLTELGMSPEAYRMTMVDDEARIRFTTSPLGNVLGGWLNISIKLDFFDEFIA